MRSKEAMRVISRNSFGVFIRVLSLIIAAVMAVSCSGNKKGNERDEQMEDASGYNGFLKVSKEGRIIDEKGKEIVLKGVNLGGWLIQESWMCAVNSSESNLESLEILEQRGFTSSQIEALYRSYAENYVTEEDIKSIAELSLNCIRLPFWYRNFMDGSCKLYSDDPENNFGFQMMDRLIFWAEKYGIYVILDMHGCPGGQSTDHSCGQIGQNGLYTDEKYLSAMEELWVAIALRYKDSKTVVAYDIMNEPMNNNSSYENGWAAGSQTAVEYTLAVYDRMIKAIREVDKNHIITVEGVWSAEMLPDPSEYGWENMMYQLHLYDTSTEMIDYRVSELTKVRKDYGVAVYVGEFNNGDENQAYAYRKYAQNDLCWTMWTYKVSKDYLGNWSLYYSAIPSADIKNDSYEEILEKWGVCLKTENFTRNDTVYSWLKTFAKR